MTLQIRGTSTIASASGTSQSVNKVTGTASGDLMFMLIGIVNTDNRILQIPDGWAVWPRTAYIPTQGICMVLWKIAGGSEPSSYTVTYSVSATSNLALISFYSDTASGVKVEDVAAQYNGVLDFTFPSVTFASSAGIHACFGFGTTASATPTTGYSEQFDGDTGYRLYCQTKTISGSGATGSKATTGTDQDNVGVSFALAEGTFTAPNGPSHRETVSVGPSTVTSQTLAAPSNLHVGDLMVMMVGFSGTDSTPSVSGWSTPTNGSLTGSTGAYLFTKIAQVGDIGATFSITWGGASRTVLIRLAAFFSPLGSTLTVDDCQQLAETSQNLNFPAATATGTNEYWLRLASSSNTLTGSQSTGTQVYRLADSGSGPRQVWLGSVLAASGSTGTDQTTRSSSGGNVNKSFSLLIREVATPGAPSSLTATTASDSQINLSWNDNATNEDNYIVEHSTDGSSWSTLTTLAANTTSYNHTGLSEHSLHYYRVKATNSISGDSGYSNTANATTSIKAPSSLAVNVASASQLNLSWTDNSGVEDGFSIERSATGSGSWSVIHTNAANSVTYNDTGLSENATWYYRVRAYVGSDFSAYSSTVSNTTLLATPTGLSASAVDDAHINLTWTDNSSQETSYRIERSPDNSTWAEIGSTAANATSYADSGLSELTIYHYRVRGKVGSNYSSYSSTANATTPASFKAPGSMAAETISAYRVRLTWTDLNSTELGTIIERSPNGSTGWTVIATLGPNVTTYDDTTVTPNTTYYFRARNYK